MGARCWGALVVTLFGRDSLIVSLQNTSVSTGFARGALKRLAQYQATERDDYPDAQPGKILHEMRFGELAHFRAIPHTPYYGTADATILYLLVLSESYRWTGDMNLLREYRKVAEGCLDWIDHNGDLDGDGFQEYKTYSPLGYENVNWKDSGDSVVYADGSQVKQPKGTCELQGYVYDAKVRMAEIFSALGDEARAQALLQQAETLKRRFQEVYWMEQEGRLSGALSPRREHSPGLGLGLRLSDAADHPWIAGRCPPQAALCQSDAARVVIGPPVAAPACRSVHVHPPLLARGRPLALGSGGEESRSRGDTGGSDPGHRRT